MRVRWTSAGKFAAAAVGVLLALQALPALLKPPAPPPLPPDVGLPRTVPGERPPDPSELHQISGLQAGKSDAVRKRGTGGRRGGTRAAPATAVIADRPHRGHRHHPRPAPAPAPTAEPTRTIASPPAPEPAPA